MCLETMDTNSKRIKTDCLRKTMKAGSKLRWRLLHVSAEEDEAFKHFRASAMRATIRKYLRRQQRRPQLAKFTRIIGDVDEKEKRDCEYEESPTAACVHPHQPGAMAPENTTQYLMGHVYEDMKMNKVQTVPVSHETSALLYAGSLSPSSVYTALDSGYESCLAFQQRDFDEVFGLYW